MRLRKGCGRKQWMMQQRTRFGAFWDAERTDLRDAVKAQLGSKRSSWIGQVASGHCNASPGTAGVIVDAYNAVAGKRVLGLGDMSATCAACPHYKAFKGSQTAADVSPGIPRSLARTWGPCHASEGPMRSASTAVRSTS
jgi:hypothetical protein